MLEIGPALTYVAVTTLGAVAVGALLLGSQFALRPAALRLALRAAVGFLVISYAVYALVLVGLAGPSGLKVLYLVCGLIALAWLVSGASRGGHVRWHRSIAVAKVGPSGWLLASLAAAYGSWAVLCATLPASAPDELIHHLAVPRRLLEVGGSVPFPDNIYAYFPAFGEMLFLFGLGVGGEVAARLLHAVFGGLVALALYGFSRRHLSVAASAWSVAIFLSVPSVMVILPWAYVDLMFTLYSFLAVALLGEYFESGALSWAVLSGTMAGAAFATKYTGLPLIMLLVLFVLVNHLRARRPGLPAAAIALATVGVALASPYLWRNWEATGWPLFPFEFGPLDLRPGVNWDRDRAALFLTMLASYGSGEVPAGPASLWDSLVAPVLVFVGARFGDARWYDGVVGPVFLLVPVLLWRRRRSAGVPFLALFALTSLVYWGLTTRQVRFLIPALPVMSFLLAAGIDGRRPRATRIWTGACPGTRSTRPPIDGSALTTAST